MSSIQVSKCGQFSVNIPVRLARKMQLCKGDNAIVRKGKDSSEIIVSIEREKE